MAVVIGLYACASVVLALVLHGRTLANFFNDDSFFYLKIADNIGHGVGSTFDGFSHTNGYHPLWTAVLAGIARIAPLRGFGGLRVAFVANAAFVTAGLLFSERLLARVGVGVWWRVAAILAIVRLTGFRDVGMETALSLAATAALLYVVAVYCTSDSGRRRGAAVAAAAFIVPLSRSDDVAFVVLVGLLGALAVRLSGERAKALRLLGLTWISGFVAYGGFALWNVAFFGHISTTSARLKLLVGGTFRAHWLAQTPAELKARMLFAGVLGLGSAIAIGVRSWRARVLTSGDAVLIAAGLYAAAYPVIMLGLLSSVPGFWYLGLPLALACIAAVGAASPLLADLSERRTLLGVGLVVVSGLLGLAIVQNLVSQRRATPDRAGLMGLADAIRRHTPKDARVFDVDGSGVLGYFGRRAVIDGDGLVNSWHYGDVLASGRIADYLRASGASFVVTDQPVTPNGVALVATNWKGGAHFLGVLPSQGALAMSGRYRLYRVEDFTPYSG